jgi:MFS family permease
MVFSMAGGVAADRVNRVRLVQSGQAANAMLIFALAGLTLANAVELWQLYAITVVNGAFTASTQPARTAVIPLLVPRENLVNAIALNATITQTAQIAGPALAGVAIGVVGLGWLYTVNGVLYIFAMLALVAIRVPSVRGSETESPWRSLLDGLVFVRRRSVIISLLLLDVGETVLGSYRALLPILAANLGVGAGGYGLLSAAPGVGSVAGAALMLSLGDVRYKGLFAVFGVLAYCAALILLALSPWFALSLLAAALLGMTNSVQVIPRNSAILSMSPDALRGRVEAFRSMLAGGGPPLGYTLSGAMAAALGPAAALVAGAIACIVFVLGIAVTQEELRDPYLGTPDKDGDKAVKTDQEAEPKASLDHG